MRKSLKMTVNWNCIGNHVLLASLLAGSLAIFAHGSFAASTQKWEQNSFEDFEEGTAKKISIRSDGKVMLAPRFDEIYDAAASYLWALVSDSQGNVFTAGGPEARVYRISPSGEGSKFFETDALEIHALAVDRDDNLYAATAPDSKIYRIDPAGRSSLFFDPETSYVWAMAFDSRGDLFLATGDQGRVYRVTPEGESSVFFETEETHVRSILIDTDDHLIIGTDPSGLVLRVSNVKGERPRGFVLHQSSKKEITALALGGDQSIYAAGVGTRSAVPTATPAPGRATPPATGVSLNPSLLPGNPAPPENPTNPTQQRGAAAVPVITPIVGGSEVYRIRPDGETRVVWDSKTDIIYALALDQEDRLVAGSGDRGRLLRIESETLYSLLLTTASSQITALARGPGGKLLAATSNIAKVYQLGPGLEKDGSFESEVFDAETFSEWGRVEWRGGVTGSAKITVATRSGNLNSPHRNWSQWSKPIDSPGGRISESPPARFAQWKAVMSAAGDGDSPVLESVNLYYLPRNVAPVISALEATAPNYEFVKPTVTINPRNVTLPALGGRSSRRGRAVTVKVPRPGQSLKPAKGFLGIRWQAEDANGDELVFRVEIRGEGEENWILLEEETDHEFFDWDSTSLADGMYETRVTASDSPSNPSSEAKADSQTVDGIIIDNTAPEIRALTVEADGGRLRVRFTASDETTKVARAEHSVDGGDWKPVLPASRLFDSKELTFDFRTSTVGSGEHTLAVRVYDEHENVATGKSLVR